MKSVKHYVVNAILLNVIVGFFLVGCDQSTGEKVYSERYTQYGYAVGETDSGGFVLAGNSVEKSGSFSDMCVMKVDAKGDVKWRKTVGYKGEDIAYDVCVASDGGYVAAGVSETKGPDEINGTTWGTGDARIVKFSSNGNKVWDYWGGFEVGRDTVRSIEETRDGGFIATGYASASVPNKGAVLIIQLDSNGNEVLKTRIDDPHGDMSFLADSIKVLSDGYIIGGHVGTVVMIEGEQRGGNDGFIMKISTDIASNSADMEWVKTYGEIELDESFEDLQLTDDGGFIAAGYKTDSFYGGSYREGYIVKTNADGNVEWEKTFTGDGSSEVDWDGFSAVTMASDGGFVVAGETKSYGVKSKYRNDVLLVKYSSHGAVQWVKAYDDNGQDNNNYAKDLILLSGGGFGVFGSTYRGIMNGMDFYCLKLNGSGDLE